jgi:hypothetical protein
VLASFEYAKGTILQHNNVVIAEGALPACAQERAVEAERKRTQALVLAKRKLPVHCNDCKDPLNLPKLPADEAVALPSLFEGAPKSAADAPPVELQMPRQGSSTGPFTPDPGQLPKTTPISPGQLPPATGEGAAAPMGSAPGWTGRTQWAGQSGAAVPPSPPPAGTVVPPARQEQFGASQMPPPSPLTRDSTPSLYSDSLGTSAPASPGLP